MNRPTNQIFSSNFTISFNANMLCPVAAKMPNKRHSLFSAYIFVYEFVRHTVADSRFRRSKFTFVNGTAVVSRVNLVCDVQHQLHVKHTHARTHAQHFDATNIYFHSVNTADIARQSQFNWRRLSSFKRWRLQVISARNTIFVE